MRQPFEEEPTGIGLFPFLEIYFNDNKVSARQFGRPRQKNRRNK